MRQNYSAQITGLAFAFASNNRIGGAIENNGRDLKLSYKGGSNSVVVPENVPIVTFLPAARTDLTAGKKVFVVAAPGKDGEYAAQRIVVEKDGVAPPM